MQGLDVRLEKLFLALVLLADQLLALGHVDVQQRRQRTHIDDVLEELALARIAVGRVADLHQRHADDVDVLAELARRQRFGRIVEEVPAGLDLGYILVPRLRVHGDHEVDAAAAPAEPAALGYAHLVPRGQALDVRREDVARAHGDAHAKDRLREKRVGRRGAGPVDVRELDDEVVDRCYRLHMGGDFTPAGA